MDTPPVFGLVPSSFTTPFSAMRTLLITLALSLVFPLTAVAQDLPNENSEVKREFMQSFHELEQQIRDQGLNPRKLSVGYQFQGPDGDSLTLSEGSNPWSKLYEHPKYFGQPDKNTLSESRSADSSDATEKAPSPNPAENTAVKASEDSGWWLLTRAGIYPIAAIVFVFIILLLFRLGVRPQVKEPKGFDQG